MQFTRTSLAIAVSVSLTACGGGGGGGGGGGLSSTLSPYSRSSVPFQAPQRVNGYQPMTGTTYRSPVTDVFVRDLNNDGKDEVMASNVGFSAGGIDWQNSNLQIWGFNTGSFTNETTRWFSGNDNEYIGGTTIRFGDFNGDGNIDAVAPTFTDTNLSGPAVVLMNSGTSSFNRVNLDMGDVVPHDSAVADLDGDGYSDIIVTDAKPAVAFGSNTGAFTVYRTDAFGGGSGISVADYLGDGTRTIVITDAPGTTVGAINYDTKLYSWSIVAGKLVLTEVAVLPADRFYLAKWDAVRASAGVAPHAVRSLNMDFNNDGRTDVVVFSTMPKNGNSHGYSEVQFLRNDGAGAFTDVTDSVLAQYDTNKSTTYSPQLADINNDGLMDIVVSAVDYTGQPSTSVLLNTTEGKFVESYLQVFQDLNTQTKSLTGASALNPQVVKVVQGPNNKLYLWNGIEYSENGVAMIAVYLSEIGSTGTVTAQATAAVLSQVWPWLNAADTNEVLARTAGFNLDGVPVIDFQRAMQPVGGLGISLDGRNGARQSITGGISAPGLDNSVLKSVTAVDALGRDYHVDMSGMGSSSRVWAVGTNNIDSAEQNWSQRFVGDKISTYRGFSAAGNGNNWTSGVNTSIWTQPWNLGLSVTRMDGSPWLGFNGVFGRINSSTILDSNLSRTWNNGVWAQMGIMQTVTDITPGLVTDVDPIWAGYAAAGYRPNQAWNLFGGVQPKIISGSLDLRLPGRVDEQGVLHYDQHNIKLRDRLVGFAGASYTWKSRQQQLKTNLVVNSQGNYQTQVTYEFNF